MANPFQEHGGLIMSEEQVKAFAREILFHFLVNKDPSVSDASITASIDKLESDMQEVIEKTKIEKNFTWHNPFYIKVPKNTTYPVTIDIDGIDITGRAISIGMKVPISFFTNVDNTPHILYANGYAIKIVKKLKYDADITSSTVNNIFMLEIPEVESGTISVKCINSEVREYNVADDIPAVTLAQHANKELRIAPDTHIPELADVDRILRTRSDVQYIDFITSSMMVKQELAGNLDPKTAYFTREDDNTDNLTFTYDNIAEAKRELAEVYKRIPHLWRYITVKFDDNITNIDGLFENTDYPETVKSIEGANITSANNLYRNSGIGSISPSLLSGMPLLSSVTHAFAGTHVTSVPHANDLLPASLTNATGLFADSSLKKDPEYWKHTNADLTGYVSKTLDDPIAPNPYQGYNTNRAYPSTFDSKNLVFKNVAQFKAYYPSRIRAYNSTETLDPTDMSAFTITIEDGNLDGMFENTNIVKLPKMIVAPKATSAKAFAKNVTTLINTDAIENIFTACPKLSNVTEAFSGCTGLTKGFEFIGATDTVSNYSRVFFGCANINKDTIPCPWRWNGLDGYPDDIVGTDGLKGIPNLPNWVPKSWGGPGTEQDTQAHTGARSAVPLISSAYIGDTMFSATFPNLIAGDLIEIAMVDPDARFTVKGDIKRIYATVGNASAMHFGISDITEDKHAKLLNTDCIRIRVREMRRTPDKLWSEYIYQTPAVRLVPVTPTTSNLETVGFITDGEV